MNNNYDKNKNADNLFLGLLLISVWILLVMLHAHFNY